MLQILNSDCTKGTYILFRNLGCFTKRKTRTYSVVSESGRELGHVGWYGSWRKYAFFPYAETLYEETCLREIAEFCERATEEHRASWKK